MFPQSSLACLFLNFIFVFGVVVAALKIMTMHWLVNDMDVWSNWV